jgi:hypothetical protein
MNNTTPRHSALKLLSAFQQRLTWSHLAQLSNQRFVVNQISNLREETWDETIEVIVRSTLGRVENLKRSLSNHVDVECIDYLHFTLMSLVDAIMLTEESFSLTTVERKYRVDTLRKVAARCQSVIPVHPSRVYSCGLKRDTESHHLVKICLGLEEYMIDCASSLYHFEDEYGET